MKIAPKYYRMGIALSYDSLATSLAWVSAYFLCFNFEIPQEHKTVMIDLFLMVLVIQVSIFIIFGLYRNSWRFFSIGDVKQIITMVFISMAIVGLILFIIGPNQSVPGSVIILDPILLIMMMAGSRFFYRLMREYQIYGPSSNRGKPVIVLGAGEGAIKLLKDLAHSKEWHVVGIVDENESMQGRFLQGIKIYGGFNHLENMAKLYGVCHVIFSMPYYNLSERFKVLDVLYHLKMKAFTVPSIDDLVSGRLTISQIRPVDVEDLLGRHTVDLDNSGLKSLISGHAVLVSGAGGSIGAELCRQIIKFNPKHLICLDISEYALYILEQELTLKDLSTKFVYIVGDVKHASRIYKILREYQPKVVFHAAAYKHVPLMENDNVSEAINNNVLGTFTLATACKKFKVDKFVLISTDKAVNPTSVMGASKRLAEMVCQGLQDKKSTRFVITRFGNVLGSSGSVIPKFREQIIAGGPITVTHPEITRYFMSIPEAAKLVMQASLICQGGEIFLLDMGKPIKIVDLAKEMIKLSGFTKDEIRIEFTGLRPGEKLYEELVRDDEQSLPTSHKKLRISSEKSVDEKWVNDLLRWISNIHDKDETLVKAELKNWVEDYQQSDIHSL